MFCTVPWQRLCASNVCTVFMLTVTLVVPRWIPVHLLHVMGKNNSFLFSEFYMQIII